PAPARPGVKRVSHTAGRLDQGRQSQPFDDWSRRRLDEVRAHPLVVVDARPAVQQGNAETLLAVEPGSGTAGDTGAHDDDVVALALRSHLRTRSRRRCRCTSIRSARLPRTGMRFTRVANSIAARWATTRR